MNVDSFCPLSCIRPFRDVPFISVPDCDSFGSLIWSNSTPVFLDDEFRFYFGAYSGRWSGGKENFLSKPTGIGMATMPRDRFAGIRPIEKLGQITLEPITFEKITALSLNADVADGAIRMEILTSDGRKLEGYTKEESEVIRGDDLRHPVAWNTNRISDFADWNLLAAHLPGKRRHGLCSHSGGPVKGVGSRN